MDKPISVSFRWTAKEMIRAQQLHMRHAKQSRKLRWIAIGGGVFFILNGIARIVRPQNFVGSAFPCFFIAGIFLLIPLLMSLFVRRAFLKMYAQKPDRDRLVTYEISADRITTRSEVVSTDMLWRAIIRARRLPEGFLLYCSEMSFHWLPIHGFSDPADVERFAQLIKSNVQQYDDAA